MLVGILFENMQVECEFVPLKARNILTVYDESCTNLSYEYNGKTYKDKI